MPPTSERAPGRSRLAGRALAGLAGLVVGSLLCWTSLLPRPAPMSDPDLEGTIATLRAAIARPARPYLVVDIAANRFALHRPDGALLRQGPCSTGSDRVLEAPDGRRWRFETPRGPRTVQAKAEDPLWRKPDWAYLEDGAPIPPGDAPDRVFRGMLGRFSLDLGDGYLVHGALYDIDIGRSVTHGCVRLGDEDLEAVHATLDPGDPVYLF